MSQLQHQRESKALVLCARSGRTSGDLEALRALVRSDFDWDYFYRLARRHSLLPLVYKTLDGLIKEVIPAEVVERFRKDYQANTARNLILADELSSLAEALAEKGIEAIAFKGPALAVAAYGDLNLRRFIDLDLIVQRADVPRAIETLNDRGYAAAKALDDDQQALLVRYQHNLQFTRGRIIVELHWQVASELFASSVTAEDLWQNCNSVEVAGKSLKTLGNEDLLFALSVHGSRHLWQRLAWICDLDRIIKTARDIDWDALLKRAERAKASRMFLLGPALAEDQLRTELPANVSKAIAGDARITALVAEVTARLFDGPEQQVLTAGATFRFNLQVRTDWGSRLRYCRFLLAPTDSDVEMMRLSPIFHFAYYLLRPVRLLRGTPAPESRTERSVAN